MATSGSVDFAVTRDEIITEALEQLGVLEAGETATTADVTSAAFTLNMLVKTWQTDGLNVFSVKNAFLFTEKSKSEYTLSTNGDNYTYSYTKQTIDGAVASGLNSITLTDASSALNGDYIGIYLDDGTMQWTTINGAPAGNVVTLSAALTDDVSDGATVYFYTDKADAPDSIIESSLINNSLNQRIFL